MKKAVITILGTISKPREGQEKAEYFLSDSLKKDFSLKKDKYTNMLPLLVDNLQDTYGTIECIYTEDAKKTQSEVLKYENLNFKIEDKGFYISNTDGDIEAQYSFFLEKNNEIIEKYDRVIIDVSHGFRHLPILATVNMIMQNIKDPEKIEYIFFAKEIKKFTKYEIIDLKEYLDLASLSFLIKNFSDNYTISSNIKIINPIHKELVEDLSNFSKDIMALSANNLFFNSYPKLDKTLEKMQNDLLLKDDIKLLRKELEIFKYREHKRYKLYYKLAKNLTQKDYLLQSVALIAEAKGFYVKSSFKSISKKIKKYFEKIEEKIEKGQKFNKNDKYTYYQLNQECKKIYSHRYEYLISEKNKNFKYITNNSIIKEIKNSIGFNKKFKDFIWHDLRNQLVHANSIENIADVKSLIIKEINEFEEYCMTKNILNCSS